jgi:Holliday junction resolvase RusA-like endonuclease
MGPAMSVVLVIDGEVEGKRRHRVRVRGRIAQQYPDPLDKPQAARVVRAWQKAGEPNVGDAPVRMVVDLYTRRPLGHWRVGGELSALGLRTPVPSRKPDVDNAAKAIMDALNGRLYKDDQQVVELVVARRWLSRRDAEPFARVSVCQAVAA